MTTLPYNLDHPCYHDDEQARVMFEAIRWPYGPVCPYCGEQDAVSEGSRKSMGPGWHWCGKCRKNFTVRVGSVAVNEIEHWEFAEPDEDDAKTKSASYETTSVYGFGHPLYYDNVIKVLRGEAEPETDGREGLKSLETIIATYLSARDGKRVPLPLDF